jgi:2-keto-4-pentenoate hydratase/2-oxohepta-3-ene-1,7-dioic acid hydratase in catechol pathway
MRLATIDGRPALVSGQGHCDIERASGGRFPADALGVLERWEEFTAWAGAATGSGGPAELAWAPFNPKQLGPPVPFPRQVFALAVNYKDHAAEAGADLPEAPIVFTKFPTCIAGPYDDILLPSNRADWEVELVVVIGPRAHRVARERSWDHVAGLTIGQDISERRVQFRKPGPHLAMAKSFPTFGPTGPWLVTPDEFASRDDIALRCGINGEPMQDSRTSFLIFGVAELIASLSAMVPLLPGDLIFTGTPSGVGSTRDPRRYLSPGDVITSEIDGIGVMRNTCVEAS